MPSLFSKTVESLTAQDVEELVGWPESLTLEFKEALSTRDGRPDAWLSGGKVGDTAREKLLKEVVAFANTSGGHVILGMAEDRGPPPTAREIKPISRCVELAQRLSQMAQHIDPPVPLLLVHGVPVEGDAGIVVFRVPESRAAPHRAPDLECYVRRGVESVPVGMREIQDMAIAATRRGEWFEQRRARFSAAFQEWLEKARGAGFEVVGVRATALPTRVPLETGRLYEQPGAFRCLERFKADVGTGPFAVEMIRCPRHPRAILRGVRYIHSDEDNPSFLELHSDGCCSAAIQIQLRSERGPRAYLSWLVALIANVVRGADYLRSKGQAPDTEYAIELEFGCNAAASLRLHSWGVGFDDAVGELAVPLLIPAIAFGPSSDLPAVVGALLTDVRDAAGGFASEPLIFSAIAPMP